MSSPPHGSRQSTPSTSRRASSRPPLGVKVICIVGAIGIAFSLFGALILLGEAPLLGLVLFGLAIATAFVLAGLWRLERWAWTWGIVLYGLGAFFDLLTADVFGLLISIVVVVYLVTIEDEFE